MEQANLSFLEERLNQLLKEIEQQKLQEKMTKTVFAVENVLKPPQQKCQVNVEEPTSERALAQSVIHYIALIENLYEQESKPKSLIYKKVKFEDSHAPISGVVKREFIEIIDILYRGTDMKKYEVIEYLFLKGLKSLDFTE